MKRLLLVLLALNFSGCSTMAQIGFICAGVIGAGYIKSSGFVTHVYLDSPAQKIGMLDGDILIHPNEYKGRPGDQVTVYWKHQEENGEFTYHEKTTNLVCVDDILEGEYKAARKNYKGWE